MNFLIKTTLLAGALLFALSLAAWADNPALNITEVAVDVPTTGHITITGEALDFGPGPLVVTLGNLGELATFGTPDATTIVVVCPGMGPACPIAGDFLLTVSDGNGKKQNDEYDLTFGAGKVGVSGYEKVIQGPVTIPATTTMTVHAVCSTGKRVFGGGYSSATAQVLNSFPVIFGNDAWRVDFRNNFSTAVSANVFAICAN